MPALNLDSATTLPRDGTAGALAGRIWHPTHGGPAVVAVREDGVYDVTAYFPTMRDLAERTDPADALRAATGERVGSLDDILALRDLVPLGVEGAIVGKALYARAFTLAEALDVAGH